MIVGLMVATNGCLSNGVEVLSHTLNPYPILSFFRDEERGKSVSCLCLRVNLSIVVFLCVCGVISVNV